MSRMYRSYCRCNFSPRTLLVTAGPSLFLAAMVCLVGCTPALGQETKKEAETKKETSELPFQPGKDWQRLARDYEVWVNLTAKQVLVGGRICLREGLLEMFACPTGTKEHEAIVAVNTPARYVHAGLLAIGAQPGTPVQFQPAYKPAQGPEIDVQVIWKDAQGQEQRTAAQQWVKQTKTGKALHYPWVFAGSGFWIDEDAGERFYSADGGEFICVSNFPTAMLDLPVESSDANDTLMFCAFTERIPPLGTRVFLLLAPKPDKSDQQPPDKEQSGSPPKEKGDDTDKPAAKQPVEPAAKKQDADRPGPG